MSSTVIIFPKQKALSMVEDMVEIIGMESFSNRDGTKYAHGKAKLCAISSIDAMMDGTNLSKKDKVFWEQTREEIYKL